MVYSSRRTGLPGGLVNTGTRAAGNLWTRVQAHPSSDQSTSRPGCATWPAPAAPTTRREPLLWFPLRPPRPHRSLGYTPLTMDHALRGAGPRSTSSAHAVLTRRSVRWRSASPSHATYAAALPLWPATWTCSAGLPCRRRVRPASAGTSLRSWFSSSACSGYLPRSCPRPSSVVVRRAPRLRSGRVPGRHLRSYPRRSPRYDEALGWISAGRS